MYRAARKGRIAVTMTAVTIAATGCTDDALDLGVDPGPPAAGREVRAGELCTPPLADRVRIAHRAGPVAVAPGAERTFDVVVTPDLCSPTSMTFSSSNEAVVAPPAAAPLGYGQPSTEVTLVGGNVGSATLTATLLVAGEPVTYDIEVDVLEAALDPCRVEDGQLAARLEAGRTVFGGGALAAASASLPAGADRPNEGSFLWRVSAFDIDIECGATTVPPGYEALGPAVTFGPADRVFPRDIPFSVPVNPARLPARARDRHLRVAYQGPAFRTPRIITVTDPRLERVDGAWRLAFRAPRLGTYQAVVDPDAGSRVRRRRLTYRAIVGPSMGGAGAAQVGLRHHHLFDAVVPLGGPIDWTYMLDHMQKNHIGGFPSIAPGTELEDIALTRAECADDSACPSEEVCLSATANRPGRCTRLPVPRDPYEHPSTFNSWWYEPGEGNGGTFSRRDYVNIFRDLALNFGNPFSYNPTALHLSAGMDPTHPAFTGGRDDDACLVWVSPYDDPDEDRMRELARDCPRLRCDHTLVLSNYYDDAYNPDGRFPVITFCDGGPQQDDLTPYANTWAPDAQDVVPVDMGLAVDYNGNGRRDEMEPVIEAGTEPWDDWGTDGIPSAEEPGYGPTNLDPAGDDYDPRFNPLGTENDHRYQGGEPFRDVGLDGVANTADSPYDFGEGDGVFTVAVGRQRFWDADAHSIVREMPSLVTTPFDDASVSRLDILADGGTRDLFNFYVAAEHFLGGFLGRERPTAIYTDYEVMPGPGRDPGEDIGLEFGRIFYDDMAPVVLHRYGSDDPTDDDVAAGSGMHAGTAEEVLGRLAQGLYFIGSRWKRAPRALVEASTANPADDADPCEILGNCFFDFTSSFGRTGPVAVSIPPGYAHADLQDLRYPVIYVTHGYGQSPEDLAAIAALYGSFANGSDDSFATRLPKPILVYVDGRCRQQPSPDGSPARAECFRGSFYADSPRPDGLQNDAWLLELMDHIDRRFRTMREEIVDERY
ncbi:MAG: hypothetical protein AAGN82_02345 [Myxococcota bacterium]